MATGNAVQCTTMAMGNAVQYNGQCSAVQYTTMAMGNAVPTENADRVPFLKLRHHVTMAKCSAV